MSKKRIDSLLFNSRSYILASFRRIPVRRALPVANYYLSSEIRLASNCGRDGVKFALEYTTQEIDVFVELLVRNIIKFRK